MKKLLPLAAILLLWAAAVNGTEDPEQPERKIEIFPNPVTQGRLTITSSEDIRSVHILNIAGKTVFTQDYEPNTGSVVIELDKLEKGIYLVRIGFANEISHTEKIMIK
jgi:hypothetical protein